MANETDVILRPWKKSDREELAALANDRRIWLNLRDQFPHPYHLEDADRFIDMALKMNPATFRAIVVSGALAGSIGYSLHRDVERIAAEVGYWVGIAYWGRGIATRAVRLISGEAFSKHPELRRLYAVPYCSNPASARVLEKAGWQREGVMRQSVIKDGVVLDQCLYAILRSEFEAGG